MRSCRETKRLQDGLDQSRHRAVNRPDKLKSTKPGHEPKDSLQRYAEPTVARGARVLRKADSHQPSNSQSPHMVSTPLPEDSWLAPRMTWASMLNVQLLGQPRWFRRLFLALLALGAACPALIKLLKAFLG
jgi:hypothetical protein